MKRQTNFLIYIMLAFALMAISVAGTLALIADSESKIGNILNFGKVSIYADNAGEGEKLTVLSTTISSNLEGGIVANGDKIIDENNAFKVATTNDSADCFLRVRFYFTTDNEEINESNEALLESMSDCVPAGMNLYSTSEYEYAIEEDWAYLVVTDGTKNLLKVATKDDNSYIITNDYTMSFDETLMLDITELSIAVQEAGAELLLVTEVYAIQAYNLKTIENMQNSANANNEILSAGVLEEKYGNVTIRQFIKAVLENAEKSGLPTISNLPLKDWSWTEVKAASNFIAQAYTTMKESNPSFSWSSNIGTAIKVDKNVHVICDGVSRGYITGFTLNDKSTKTQVKISLKDEINIDFGDYKTTVIVTDFLHDTYIDENGKEVYSGITFSTKHLFARKTCGAPAFSDNGYGVFTARLYLLDTVLPMLNKEIADLIVPTKKAATKGDKSTSIEYFYDKLWLFSLSEMNTSYSNISSSYKNTYAKEGKAYPIFTNDASRIRTWSDGSSYSAGKYWLRSPDLEYRSRWRAIRAYDGFSVHLWPNDGNIAAIVFGFCV